MYNIQVARAFLRQVYIAEGLAPPTSAETVTSAYRTLFEHARNPAYWKGIAQSGEWARVALYGIEAYGIFHIGEMSESAPIFSSPRTDKRAQSGGGTLWATSSTDSVS